MRLIFILLVGLQSALCCELEVLSVKRAVKAAEIVFRGSIVEVRDAEILFRVDRVWKGRVPPVFSMPKLVWIGSPCLPGFSRDNVRPGAELLVYARHLKDWGVEGYVTAAGSRTRLVQNATEDLSRLGRGRPPTSEVIRRSPAGR
jgi:hypothetical protein